MAIEIFCIAPIVTYYTNGIKLIIQDWMKEWLTSDKNSIIQKKKRIEIKSIAYVYRVGVFSSTYTRQNNMVTMEYWVKSIFY